MRPETIAAIDAAIAEHRSEQSYAYMLHLAHVAVGRAADAKTTEDENFYALRAIA